MTHLRRLLPYLRERRGRYALGLAFVLLAAASGAAVPLVIREAIRALEHGSSRGFIAGAAAAIVLFAGVRGAFTVAGRNAILLAARGIEHALRNDIYRHLARLPASFYDTHPSGDITSRIVNDLEGARLVVGIGLISVVGTGLVLLASLAGMFWLDARLALLCMAPLAAVSVVTWATGAPLHARSLALQDQLGVLSSRAQENFAGARVVRAFAQEDRETDRWRGACDEYLRRALAFARTRGVAYALITFFTELAIAVTLWAGGRGMIEGTLAKEDFVAFTAYQFMLVWPMIAIGWTITIAQRGAACMGRIAELLGTPPEADAADPGPVDFAGRIEIRGLTFRYEADREPALRDVSLAIEPGRTVAVVGRTGAGKSTLAALLTRLYPAPRGTVFIDGRDVNDIPIERQRRAVGCVPQDPFLFSDTIRGNIAFGGEGDVPRAATLSRIAADAERFPGRLDQMIGERGVTLSGGQKQRVAIARAVVRDPAILVLDDALSSVDAQTEREILGELRAFMKDRTSLVITHRLSAVRDADRIVVLENGAVAEAGTHDELLGRKGAYAAMWERQQLIEELDRA